MMPVQYGFPPEAATARLPAEGVRASKKDGSNELQDVIVDSPLPGDNVGERQTPSKTEAPGTKKRSGGGKSGPPAAKKPKDSSA